MVELDEGGTKAVSHNLYIYSRKNGHTEYRCPDCTFRQVRWDERVPGRNVVIDYTPGDSDAIHIDSELTIDDWILVPMTGDITTSPNQPGDRPIGKG